jgi:hypothetical protein
MNHIPIIDKQYCVSEYYHLHPGALLCLHFWSMSIHVFWARSEVALSHSCAFSLQLLACRSFNYVLINIARHPHGSSSCSFFLISMTYHKHLHIFHPCAPGQWGELCSWRHGWMQYNGRHTDRVVLWTDHAFDNLYCCSHLHFVCTFHH